MKLIKPKFLTVAFLKSLNVQLNNDLDSKPKTVLNASYIPYTSHE